MVNFIKLLENALFIADKTNEYVISESPNDKYDLQININKIFGKSELQMLTENLNKNKDFLEVFNYEQISVKKGHFLCFAYKTEIMLKVLQQYHTDFPINFSQQNISPKTIIVDYSSPNMSKDMHVGHLRSTIIGDAISNVLEYKGNNVIRINHLGDFGLPFGMIVEYIIQKKCDIGENLQQIYIEAKKIFDSNTEFQEHAYLRTALLQNKTCEITNHVWTQVLNKSLEQYKEIYSRLNISQKLEAIGESFYTTYISQCYEMLEKNGLTEIDNHDRTLIKCTDGLNPLIYMKSKERGCAYTYDTTDIVTLWYRLNITNADEIYYVVDNRQSLHFEQIFNIGKQMGWLNKNKKAVHIQFGTILDKFGKPLRSRTGDTPRLIDLINESVAKTQEQFATKGKDIEKFKYEINAIAIGSIKYQDYSKCRTSDYKFNFEQMLKFEGNTYTFLSYTVARIRGIMDNVNQNNLAQLLNDCKIDLNELQEIDYKIVKKIICFTQVIDNVAETKMLHGLIDYMSKLCVVFNSNYTNSRYLHFDESGKLIDYNISKLLMCKIVLNILSTSCKLLGLSLVNVM